MFYHLSDWFDVGDLQDEGIAGIDGNSGSLEVELPRGLTWCYNHDAHHRNHVTLNPLQEDEYYFPAEPFQEARILQLSSVEREVLGPQWHTGTSAADLCSLCVDDSLAFSMFFSVPIHDISWHLMVSHDIGWYLVSWTWPGRGVVEIADVRQEGQELHVVTTSCERRQTVLDGLLGSDPP